ncbi:MAG: tetratricopeptide repeat protein [Acidobacteria bacterium]|nr:tetratricopeptide repeat protein [Acidobacteriota bacterium]
MAFNKIKSVETAQKHLNQGRISQAIAEYQQILRQEPKDQVTLMTIGDLFVRQGDTFQALEYFERLAQLFLSDGFVTKAIAIYKKIAKLAPEESKPLERLAELYVQQGVMSEARPLYLQLAEVHLKANREQQAVVLLRKLLEAEPDNLRVQARLAEIHHAMGQDKEAADTYLAAAQQQLASGRPAEADKFADRALKMEPNHAGALALKARALTAAGKRAQAATLLEGLPGLDAGTEVTALLIDLYLQGGESARAASLAGKVVERNPKNLALAFKVGIALVDAGEPDRALEVLGPIREAVIEAGEHERFAQVLTAAAERMPGQLEPLEWLVDLYGRASDSFRLPDALGQLGEAAAAAGQFERAKQVYEQLLDRDPEDEAARRKLNQVRARMGLEPLESAPLAQPSGAVKPAAAPVVEAKAAPAVAEPELDEQTQHYLAQALTDVDLFSSYGLTQKAMDLLETVLQRAPRHASTLEKLLDLNLGAGNDRRTAELAGQLEQIHGERGDAANVERFAELRRRFQRAAGMAPEEVAAAAQAARPVEFPVPTVEAEPAPPADSLQVAEVGAVPAGEAAVHEVDLSEEWAALAHQVEEALQASAAATLLAPAAPGVESHADASAVEPAVVDAELARMEASHAAEVASEPTPRPRIEPAPETPAEEVPEYELELEPALAEAELSPAKSAAEAGAVDAAAPMQRAMSAEQFLSELATELDSLGVSPAAHATPIPPPRPVPRSPVHGTTDAVWSAARTPAAIPESRPAPPVELPATAAGEDRGPLRDVFDAFRAELGELGTEEKEDLETHYNLGIAYREMGLLDEAIGEFQKVAKAIDQGRAFRYAMQCCTLLGLAFMEKGQPQIATMWYERALQTPGLDQESILALRYDLGVAQELSGDEAAALKSFSQVYAMNIDYRDVAERIATLGKHR